MTLGLNRLKLHKDLKYLMVKTTAVKLYLYGVRVLSNKYVTTEGWRKDSRMGWSSKINVSLQIRSHSRHRTLSDFTMNVGSKYHVDSRTGRLSFWTNSSQCCWQSNCWALAGLPVGMFGCNFAQSNSLPLKLRKSSRPRIDVIFGSSVHRKVLKRSASRERSISK